MTSTKPEAQRLAELEAALDTYGADRTRWPAPLRHALSGFIASNADAQQMLEEARRFDLLLDQSPAASAADIARLTDRIVAAAERQPRIVATEGAANAVKPVQPQLRRTPSRMPREQGWAAAALAASLVLGIVAGQSQVTNSAAELLISAVDQGDTSASSSQLALTDETEGLLYEDLL